MTRDSTQSIMLILDVYHIVASIHWGGRSWQDVATKRGGWRWNVFLEQAALPLTTSKMVQTFGPKLGVSVCSTDGVSSVT